MRVHRVVLWMGLLGTAAMAQSPGAGLFAQHCSACHQPDGSGTVGLAPTLKGPHWQTLARTPEYLPTVILKGLSGRIDVAGQSFVGSMPAFAGQLDDAQVLAIVSHVHGLQQRDAEALSVQDLERLRLQPGSPPQTRQWRIRLLQGQ